MKKKVQFLMALVIFLTTTFNMNVNAASGDFIPLCVKMGAEHNPSTDILSMTSLDASVAQKFVVNSPFDTILVNGCTSGNTSGSTFDFKLYKWNTDYETTVGAISKDIIETDYIGEAIEVNTLEFESHCYGAAHLFDEGKHKVWFCNWDEDEIVRTDAIWYTEKVGSLSETGGWSTPIEVHDLNVHSSWVKNHTADPTVIKGDFKGPDNNNYKYALYFTTDNGGGLNGNTIGLSFSNDGINWIKGSDGPVIWSDYQSNKDAYMAGMNAISYDPVTKQYVSLIFDSEVENGITLRYSNDGIDWKMEEKATYLEKLTNPADDVIGGQGPDLAYCTEDQHWYAVIKCSDKNGVYDGQCVLLRSRHENDLLGKWDVLKYITSDVTGHTVNHNAGLSKTGSGELYVENGYFYCFVGMGDNSMDAENVIGVVRINLEEAQRAGGESESLVVKQTDCVVTDNERTTITFETQEAGTYLWVADNPSKVDGSVGFWQFAAGGAINSETYVGGQLVSGDLEACVVEAEEIQNGKTEAPETVVKALDASKTAAGDEIPLCKNIGTEHNANTDIIALLTADASAAQKFAVGATFDEIRINGCTSGNKSGNTYDFKLYKWDTDYATTIKGKALVEKKGCVVNDNKQTSITFDEQKAGTYLWIISNPSAVDGSVGIWQYAEGGATNSVSFINGQLIEGDIEASVIVSDTFVAPKTGDSNNQYIIFTVLLISSLGVVMKCVNKKKGDVH